ncbi:MAG: DnaA N-terminal domain-containing protein, partial [Pseudomonadota bacterium]|nr:DnaA N-terminal domain-containing protein [Pseudomonadota bacterium]
MPESPIWLSCLNQLEKEIPTKEFNTWIKPLQVVEKKNSFRVLAPNSFVYDALEEKYGANIKAIIISLGHKEIKVLFEVGSLEQATERRLESSGPPLLRQSGLQDFTFESFVGGKSNQLARAAAMQVAESPGKAYNPLFI